MKHRTVGIILTEAAGCAAVWGIAQAVEGGMKLAAFPFVQIAAGLRMLSLSGTPGNAAAVVLYVLISLIPVGLMAGLYRRRGFSPEDMCFPVLTGLLFWGLYAMINPGTQAEVIRISGGITFAGAIWAVAALYLAVRIVRRLKAARDTEIARMLRAALYGLQLIFVWQTVVSVPGQTVESWKALFAANQGTESGLLPTCIFLLIGAAVDILPCIFDLILTIPAIELTHGLEKDRFAEETVNAAEHLGKYSGKALIAYVGSAAGYDLAQLIFAPYLRNTDSLIRIPLLPMIFALVTLLAAALLRDNRKLKSDNDLFI